jgi:hypothetical protein
MFYFLNYLFCFSQKKKNFALVFFIIIFVIFKIKKKYLSLFIFFYDQNFYHFNKIKSPFQIKKKKKKKKEKVPMIIKIYFKILIKCND